GLPIGEMRIVWLLVWGFGLQAVCLAEMPAFDFHDAEQVEQWAPTHDLAGMSAVPDGMLLRINGSDPYSMGPARDYPAGVPLRMTARIKPSESGTLQIYYFTRGATEAHSVRAEVKGGAWTDVKMRLPALGPRYRLRIDPPGDRGECVVESIRF